MRWLNNLKVAIGVPVTLLTIISGAAIFIPDVSEWFLGNPVLAWLLAGGLLTVLCVVLHLHSEASARTDAAVAQAKRETRRAERAEDNCSLAERANQEQALRAAEQRRKLEQGALEIRSLEARVAALQADLAAPSEQDIDQYQQVLQALDWNRGPLDWIQQGTKKRWSHSISNAIFDLDVRWREWFFDAPDVQEAFTPLRDTLSELALWMAQEGSSDGETWTGLVPRDAYYGGDEAYSGALRKGEEAAQAVVDARRNFEQAGRRARLNRSRSNG